MGKPFWRSKTFWVNIIAVIGIMTQTQFGFVISPEEQAALLGVINLILRAVTKEPIGLKCDDGYS